MSDLADSGDGWDVLHLSGHGGAAALAHAMRDSTLGQLLAIYTKPPSNDRRPCALRQLDLHLR